MEEGTEIKDARFIIKMKIIASLCQLAYEKCLEVYKIDLTQATQKPLEVQII